MYHVNGLKVAKCDPPFINPLSKMWINVIKVIDWLHIRNHKDTKCKTDYNPDNKIAVQYNTMAAEQTNVWVSRLKRIICAIPRLHQFFYLYCAVKRWNLYTQRCHINKKLPLLPKHNHHHLSILQVENWAVSSLPPGCSVLRSRCCCCPCS